MSEIDILIAMAMDFSNLRLPLEKVLQFAENVLPNYSNSKSKKLNSLAKKLMKFCTIRYNPC